MWECSFTDSVDCCTWIGLGPPSRTWSWVRVDIYGRYGTKSRNSHVTNMAAAIQRTHRSAPAAHPAAAAVFVTWLFLLPVSCRPYISTSEVVKSWPYVQLLQQRRMVALLKELAYFVSFISNQRTNNLPGYIWPHSEWSTTLINQIKSNLFNWECIVLFSTAIK